MLSKDKNCIQIKICFLLQKISNVLKQVILQLFSNKSSFKSSVLKVVLIRIHLNEIIQFLQTKSKQRSEVQPT